jgi:hypothetical protein
MPRGWSQATTDWGKYYAEFDRIFGGDNGRHEQASEVGKSTNAVYREKGRKAPKKKRSVTETAKTQA